MNPGGARCMSPAYVFAIDVLGVCGRRAVSGWLSSGVVAARVCMMLCMRLLECWNSNAIAFMIV